MLPDLPKVRSWTRQRKSLLEARWKEDSERQSLDWWKDYFETVKRSPWLLGQIKPKDGGAPFRANLEWLVGQMNFVNVLEGKYVSEAEQEDNVPEWDKPKAVGFEYDKFGKRIPGVGYLEQPRSYYFELNISALLVNLLDESMTEDEYEAGVKRIKEKYPDIPEEAKDQMVKRVEIKDGKEHMLSRNRWIKELRKTKKIKEKDEGGNV